MDDNVSGLTKQQHKAAGELSIKVSHHVWLKKNMIGK